MAPILTRVELDVSELEAPEPMRLVLVALAALKQGQCLVVSHRKEPLPLFPKLTEMGVEYCVHYDPTSVQSPYHIFIGHKADSKAIKSMIDTI